MASNVTAAHNPNLQELATLYLLDPAKTQVAEAQRIVIIGLCKQLETLLPGICSRIGTSQDGGPATYLHLTYDQDLDRVQELVAKALSMYAETRDGTAHPHGSVSIVLRRRSRP